MFQCLLVTGQTKGREIPIDEQNDFPPPHSPVVPTNEILVKVGIPGYHGLAEK